MQVEILPGKELTNPPEETALGVRNEKPIDELVCQQVDFWSNV